MRSADYLKMKLFETAWRESGGRAGIYGVMVAWCLANRVRRNMGTWLEVLQNVPRYRAAEPDVTGEFPRLFEPAVQMLLHAVDDIYDNRGEDKSNGGLYWSFTELGANDWFKEFIIGGEYSVTAIQNSLKIWGEKIIMGRELSWKL